VEPARQSLLFEHADARPRRRKASPADRLHDELAAFEGFGARTVVSRTAGVPTYTNEFWTAAQRQAHGLHEVSYRACFKPQLPRFFIDRLTRPGDRVHDPFMGRGTTPLEAALAGRRAAGSDVNPLARVLAAPRLEPPAQDEVRARLDGLDLGGTCDAPDDLLVFFHPDTLRELAALRRHLLGREAAGRLDRVDAWIRMVAVNRLTGHSPGFFSVYTLPPNQAVSVDAQRKINARRGQTPPRRDVAALIAKKSRSLLQEVDEATRAALAKADPRLFTAPADRLASLGDGEVALVVTSPPFLDVVDYAQDNWLRAWFCGVDAAAVPISMTRRLEDWQALVTGALREARRVLRPGGHVAFEVGEVRGGAVRLEEAVLPCALAAGLEPVLVLVNAQRFTKTANCWGVDNGAKGTNTNRVVLLRS
jgi:hypothetical protein